MGVATIGKSFTPATAKSIVTTAISDTPFGRNIKDRFGVAAVPRGEAWLEKQLKDFVSINNVLRDRLGAVVPPFDPYLLLTLCDNSGYLSNANRWKGAATVGQGFEADPELMVHLGDVNDDDSFQDLLDQFVLDLDTFGYAFIETQRSGITASFWNMSALRTRIKPDPKSDYNHFIHYDYGFGSMFVTEHESFLRGTQSGVRMLKLPSRRGHRYYGDPDYISAKKSLIGNVNILNLMEKFFENAFMGDMAITMKGPEYSDDEIKDLKSYIQSSMTGLENAHKVIVLQIGPNEDVKFDKLNFDIGTASFSPQRADNMQEIASSTGVPTAILGISTPMKLGGGGEFREALRALKIGFADHRQRKIEAFFRKLFRDAGLPSPDSFKLKPLDTLAGEADIPNLAAAVGAGFMTTDEAAAQLATEKLAHEKRLLRKRHVDLREFMADVMQLREDIALADAAEKIRKDSFKMTYHG